MIRAGNFDNHILMIILIFALQNHIIEVKRVLQKLQNLI